MRAGSRLKLGISTFLRAKPTSRAGSKWLGNFLSCRKSIKDMLGRLNNSLHDSRDPHVPVSPREVEHYYN